MRPTRTLFTAAALLLLTAAAAAGALLYGQSPPQGWTPLDDTGGCPLFPPEAVFNQPVDDLARFPVHPDSARWIGSIGGATAFRPDWGREEDPARRQAYYGIPYNVISRSDLEQPWPVVDYEITDARDRTPGVPGESDCAVPSAAGGMRIRRDCSAVPLLERRFPFPPPHRIQAEGGDCQDPTQCGDRHILVVESGSCQLWESYMAYRVDGRWMAYSTAAWDLRSLEMRPQGFTSGDAAGLPILPLLARAHEASSGEIGHALRVTFRDAVLDRRAEWPATHAAGSTRSNGIPFGALLRLRADFVPPLWWTPQARALARAMQRHGLYVADIGQDFFVQGEPSAHWSPLTMTQLRGLRLHQFDFVDLHRLTHTPGFSENSYRAVFPAGSSPAPGQPIRPVP